MEIAATKEVTLKKTIKKKPLINKKKLEFDEDRVYYVSQQDEQDVLSSFTYQPERQIYD